MWKIPPFWLTRTWVSFVLYPVSLLFWLLISIRKWFWQSIASRQKPPTTPVIVVGNHWIGGTGKTPIVLELIKYFQRQGLRVGIITRGYTDADTQNLIVCTQDQVPDFIRADEVRLIWQHTAQQTVSTLRRWLMYCHLLKHLHTYLPTYLPRYTYTHTPTFVNDHLDAQTHFP